MWERIGEEEEIDQAPTVLVEVAWRGEVGPPAGRRGELQLLARCGQDPPKHADGRISPPALVGRDDGLLHLGTAGQLRLCEAAASPDRAKKVVGGHGAEYSVLSIVHGALFAVPSTLSTADRVAAPSSGQRWA